MSNIEHRLTGEVVAHSENDNALGGNQGAERAKQGGIDTPKYSVEPARESSRERGLYMPRASSQLGRDIKPKPFRGKHKRKSRADAINAKRNQGAVDSGLAGLLVLATVAGVLLMGVI